MTPAEEVYETRLASEIHDSLIDADRFVRDEYGETFPNFALYRLVLCGDRNHLRNVREWWEVFCILWADANMRKKQDGEAVLLAARDALQSFMEPNRRIMTDEAASEECGLHRTSYTLMRKGFMVILAQILETYMERLMVAYARVRKMERAQAIREIFG